jgi:AcrR family transcriptional regulator
MPRAFSTIEQEQIRAKLLASGKRLINKIGMKRLTIDDLVREASISKGSFYSFYPSREDFILSVFESWEAEYRGELLREVKEGEGSSKDRIERFILGAFRIMEREPGLMQMRPRDIEALVERLPPERVAAHQAKDDSVLQDAFAAWGQAGLIDMGIAQGLQGLAAALFSIAVHRDDFPAGSFEPTVRLLAEALALRIAGGAEGAKEGGA